MVSQSEDKYYIFIIDPQGCFVIGIGGKYEETISKALVFANKHEAHRYVEKHGLQKISTVRKMEKENVI